MTPMLPISVVFAFAGLCVSLVLSTPVIPLLDKFWIRGKVYTTGIDLPQGEFPQGLRLGFNGVPNHSPCRVQVYRPKDGHVSYYNHLRNDVGCIVYEDSEYLSLVPACLRSDGKSRRLTGQSDEWKELSTLINELTGVADFIIHADNLLLSITAQKRSDIRNRIFGYFTEKEFKLDSSRNLEILDFDDFEKDLQPQRLSSKSEIPRREGLRGSLHTSVPAAATSADVAEALGQRFAILLRNNPVLVTHLLKNIESAGHDAIDEILMLNQLAKDLREGFAGHQHLLHLLSTGADFPALVHIQLDPEIQKQALEQLFASFMKNPYDELVALRDIFDVIMERGIHNTRSQLRSIPDSSKASLPSPLSDDSQGLTFPRDPSPGSNSEVPSPVQDGSLTTTLPPPRQTKKRSASTRPNEPAEKRHSDNTYASESQSNASVWTPNTYEQCLQVLQPKKDELSEEEEDSD